MAVYYKFKSARDYDSIPIDGHFISVANLKERIFESKHLGRGTDFDLMVSNAQTDEEYVDEATLIPKNTSVLVRRIPGRSRAIVTQENETKIVGDKLEETSQTKSSAPIADSSVMKFPEESDWDEFGTDLYAIPDVIPSLPSNSVPTVPPPSQIDEESKIKALIDTPALDWQRQAQDNFGPGRGFGRGMGGRMFGGRAFGRGLERKTPPPGYVCHRCKVPGHLIQHCPTNGDPNYDIKRVKPPTGIPRSMLMATPDGSYALPSGAVAVLRPNEAAFEKEIEGLPSTRQVTDLPPELHCPLCKEVIKDAVLTSKCCFSSFCDRCIRNYIISKAMCVCGFTNILADDLLPNKTLRETISRIMEATTTSSADNAGSLIQAQDMESARPQHPKVPSPTLSATKEHNFPSSELLSNIKEEVVENNEVIENNRRHAIVNKAPQEKSAPESISAKEPTSQESAPHEEEAQEKVLSSDQGKKKKKKKVRVPTNAAEPQWRSFQEMGTENCMGMPMGPSAYNPYITGMPWGMEGFMGPLPGAMPFMSYPQSPFDLPFGVMPQDPFAGQGYMMPPIFPQRDLAELSMAGLNKNAGPPPNMNREEFGARKPELRKPELRRKYESENERERPRDRESSKDHIGAEPSLKQRPKLMSQAAVVDRTERERGRSPLRGKSPARPSSSARDSARRTSSPPLPPPPPRGVKRKPEEDEDATAKPRTDLKQKPSVFSRISFPDSSKDGTGSSNKRNRSSEPPNGVKDSHQPSRRSSSSRDEQSKSTKRGSPLGPTTRKDAHDHESSEEEYHFKRRPSSSSRNGEGVDEGRPSRSSREHAKERDHERAPKRR